MASANVGSPMTSCHLPTGNWLVTMVAPAPERSSMISIRSRRWSGGEAIRPPVIEDQQIAFGQRAEQAREAAVAVGQVEVGEQPRHAGIDHGVIVAAGLLAESRSEPGLADAAGAGDQQIAMLGDPPAGGELLHERLVELARGSIVDVFDRRPVVAQLCRPQPGLEASGGPVGGFAVEQQGEPFGMVEIGGGILALQFDEGVGHAVKPERFELIDRRMGEHIRLHSVEVAGATDVVVQDDRPVRGCFGPPAVEAVLEDGVDGGVGARADLQRPFAGGFQAVDAIGLGQSENPDRSAEALFGMAAFAQDEVDKGCRIRPDPAGLRPEPLGRPVGIAPVGAGHVRGHGGVFAIGRRPPVSGDALAAMEDLDGGCRQARPNLVAQQAVGNRVIVLLDLDVIVEADPALKPFGIFVGHLRQGFQGRTVELFE